jgi:hypothetical protein
LHDTHNYKEIKYKITPVKKNLNETSTWLNDKR